MQEDIEARGIKLSLKAAGQKVGLAEVSIRYLREKARATKAGVRATVSMAIYLPTSSTWISVWTLYRYSTDQGRKAIKLHPMNYLLVTLSTT